jgi:hypothetical protein
MYWMGGGFRFVPGQGLTPTDGQEKQRANICEFEHTNFTSIHRSGDCSVPPTVKYSGRWYCVEHHREQVEIDKMRENNERIQDWDDSQERKKPK